MMDITDNNSHPISSQLPEAEVDPLPMGEEKPSFEPSDALDQPERLSRLRREVARSLASILEARDATIRELQDAIKNGTYCVTDEQIADKMLRDMLLDVLP
jgi:anti-sigma28 factor (negative regulator of flagellin synthesis)